MQWSCDHVADDSMGAHTSNTRNQPGHTPEQQYWFQHKGHWWIRQLDGTLCSTWSMAGVSHSDSNSIGHSIAGSMGLRYSLFACRPGRVCVGGAAEQNRGAPLVLLLAA